MSLPNQLKTGRMTNATLGSDIDDHVSDLEQAVADILGLPINVLRTETLFGHRVRLSRAATQSIPHATLTSIQFDNDLNNYDPNNLHSPTITNTRITFTLPGVYHIIGQASFALAASNVKTSVGFRLNGSAGYAYNVQGPIAFEPSLLGLGLVTSDLAIFVAGDFLELAVYHGAGSPVNLTSASFSAVYQGGI